MSSREPHWSVEVPTRTLTGDKGTHTFIIGAATHRDAVDAAWLCANSSEAARHRKGATLAAQRHHLTAHPVHQSLL